MRRRCLLVGAFFEYCTLHQQTSSNIACMSDYCVSRTDADMRVRQQQQTEQIVALLTRLASDVDTIKHTLDTMADTSRQDNTRTHTKHELIMF